MDTAQVTNQLENTNAKQWLIAVAGVIVTLVMIYYFVELVSRAWKRGQMVEPS